MGACVQTQRCSGYGSDELLSEASEVKVSERQVVASSAAPLICNSGISNNVEAVAERDEDDEPAGALLLPCVGSTQILQKQAKSDHNWCVGLSAQAM